MSYFKQVDMWIKSIGNGTPEEVTGQQELLRQQFIQDLEARQATRQALRS